MLLSAVLFDVDGTISETEDFHRKSFNEAFKEFNLDWFWDEAIYKELINVGGGKERIEYHINRAWPEMLDIKNLNKYIKSIHDTKNEIYGDLMKENKVIFRPGILRLIHDLKKNKVKVALVSSASEKNFISLFKDGLKTDHKRLFDFIAHGDLTKNKKPSPEIYEWTLEKLRLPSSGCIAIEDSPRGLDSALKANLKVVITPSKLSINEDFTGAKLVISDLGEENRPFNIIKGSAFNHKLINFKLLSKLNKLD